MPRQSGTPVSPQLLSRGNPRLCNDVCNGGLPSLPRRRCYNLHPPTRCQPAWQPAHPALPALLAPLPGEGGNDLLHTRQQVADQQLKRGNKALLGNIMVG